MAAAAMRRIKLPETAVATIEFLIRHHLSMSTAAFRRDVDDPEVVAQFARLVGTEQRLKLLCLMTLADVDAVSPEVMNPWKEELLWRLYVETYNRLTLEYGDEVIDDATRTLEDFVSLRPDDLSEKEVTTFLKDIRCATCGWSTVRPSTTTSGCPATSAGATSTAPWRRRDHPGS